MNVNLAEQFKIVDATAGPVTTNGGVTGDYVSLKGCKRAWISLQFTQAVGHATVIQPQKATAVAPTGAASITTAARIWSNLTTAVTDTLVKRTSATSYTLNADVAKKHVLIEIDPAEFTGDYDVLGFTISDSSQATNFVSGLFFLEMGYSQATPPAAITD
jgi:hypothetical protein